MTRRFTVVTSPLGARAVLYWPAADECVWLECWLPEKVRGSRHVNDFVSEALGAIRATHHLHFFPGIASFQQLARQHGFEPRGESPWFRDCVAFRHVTRRRRPPATIALREHAGRTPALKVAASAGGTRGILALIDADIPHGRRHV